MDTAAYSAPVVQSGSRNWIALAVCAAILVLVPHAVRLSGMRMEALDENRTLASMPALPTSLAALGEYPTKVEAALQDQFPLRGVLISRLNLLRYRLGYSVLPSVVVGRDGWLIYNGGNILSYHRGTRKAWDPAPLSTWLDTFEERVRSLKRRNAEFYLLAAPRKPTIYPERVPFPLPVRNEMDVLLEAARARGIDRIIYPREELLRAKQEREIFGPLETHWNAFGVYAAYDALMRRLAQDNPDLAPLPREVFELEASPPRPGDLSLMLGLGGEVLQDFRLFLPPSSKSPSRITYLTKDRNWGALTKIETGAPSRKTLLLIRDSFSTALLPLLERHFATIVTVHYSKGFARQDLVDSFKPDIVIIEAIEPVVNPITMPL